MKKRLFTVMLFMLLVLGGCKNEERMPEEIVFYTRFSLGKDGILYCSDLLYITDYVTGVTVPVCDKPNCAHEPLSSTNENPQCNAAYPGAMRAAFLYRDKLYVFVGDGMNHTVVYMAESTGEGRRKIAEAEYTVYGISEFQDGKAYFSAEREGYQGKNSLRQEREVFIGLFDTADQHFECLTTPDASLGATDICGITREEIFLRRCSFLEEDEKNWTKVSVEYTAKNLETGEERTIYEGPADGFQNPCVVESGIYYYLEKDGTYECWKKEADGDEIFIDSADHFTNFRPIINGEPLFEKDKSDFQKELVGLCTCGDIIFVMDRRKGGRHGIITVDNYLGDIDEIVYPEFPNMTYWSEVETVEP